MLAQDVMSSEVVTVSEGATVLDAVKLLINNGVSGLPVVNAAGAFAGIITEFDVIRHVLGGDAAGELKATWEKGDGLSESQARALARPVSDLMTRPALAVVENSPLKEIAELIVRHQIKSVPVLRDGAVVGVVSRADLVKALLSSPKAGAAPAPVDDDHIRRDVISVLQKLGMSMGGGFDVVSRGGTVHLWGRTYDDDSHAAYRAAAAKVDGVLEVHSHMQIMPMRGAIRR